MDSGCIVQMLVMLAILYAVVMAIAFAVAATMSCGAVYGCYRAMVCYATALKRTYGSDPDYDATNGIKVLIAFIVAFMVCLVLIVFSVML